MNTMRWFGRHGANSMAVAAMVVIVAGCNNQPADPGTGSTAVADVEQSTHRQINAYRASKGLAPLIFNETIAAQARAHSRDMSTGQVAFSHDGFDARVETIIKAIPVAAAAENVAFNVGFDDPATNAVTGWLDSPGHLANIEGDYSQTGIGVEKNGRGEFYFTQIFIK